MIFTAIEDVREKVIGIVPSYESSGDISKILLEPGDILWERRSLNPVKRALARCYLLDLQEQRRQLRGFFKRKRMLPFYLGPARVFIPVKVRQARIKNDCCYAYIDWRYIEIESAQGQAGTVIRVSHGATMPVLSSQATVVQNLHRGRQLYELLQQSQGQNNSKEAVLLEVARLLAGSLDLIHDGLDKPGRSG